jgi:Domain of Unknown Function (DUF1080)
MKPYPFVAAVTLLFTLLLPAFAQSNQASISGVVTDTQGAVPARAGALKPAGTWNAIEITAKGRRVQVVLNGTQILDADLDAVSDPAIRQRHPGLARASGHIGFLGHGTRVEFRNAVMLPCMDRAVEPF